jgi:CRP-like cAMP-binding protein
VLPPALADFPVVRVPTGHTLFREGSAAPVVYLVKGAARIERGPVVLDLVRAPAWVLDAGALDGRSSASSAMTLRASSVIILRTVDPALRSHLDSIAMDLIRSRTRSIDALACGSAEERLLGVLSHLAARYGAPVGSGRFIGMPLRRNDLARMVGITIETASRILARLERDGSIRSRRDGIWIASSVLLRKP